MRVPLQRSAHPFANTVAALLVVFLVLFPKGGVKLGSVPVTWGYLLLATVAPMLVLYGIVAMPWRVRPAALAAVASIVPFQVIFCYSYLANGVTEVSYSFAVLVSFFVLPSVFLLILPPFYPRIDGERFRRVLSGSIFWAAAFGILLFVWWPLTGKLIEVPLLTVNLADYGTIAETKHIYRGPFLKLISTYNNGNLYGVATLMLLPLYSLIEPRRWRRNTVRVALFLTLSRTVWAGLIVEQLLGLAQPFFMSLGSFPRLRLGGAGRRLAVVGGVLVAIVVAALLSPYSLGFLLDPSFGGRSGEVRAISFAVLPSVPLRGFSEVLFASAFAIYGAVGAAAFIFIFVLPVLLLAVRPLWLTDPSRRMALKGMLLYVIVSASDGAINLIPVMAFFWFVYSVYLYGLPGGEPSGSKVRAPARQKTVGGLGQTKARWAKAALSARG